MDAPEVEETPEEAAAYKATKAAGCTCNPAISGRAVEHFVTCALYRVETIKAYAATRGMSVDEYLGSIPVAEDPIEDARREAEEL